MLGIELIADLLDAFLCKECALSIVGEVVGRTFIAYSFSYCTLLLVVFEIEAKVERLVQRGRL